MWNRVEVELMYDERLMSVKRSSPIAVGFLISQQRNPLVQSLLKAIAIMSQILPRFEGMLMELILVMSLPRDVNVAFSLLPRVSAYICLPCSSLVSLRPSTGSTK